ncbi:MAG TPA: YbhB/YbcL family Raf kinase inhibitor-like protein [Janthinobacterium sp.]|nr:YbhB/YbcL family Raf kinase inhibitor-like protein [Janthinobacterium sp.]
MSTLFLSSSAFDAGGDIPPRYTCDGANISPPLSWGGMPPATQSLALIIDDPDAPDPEAPIKTWVHWVVYNIPPRVSGFPEGVHGGDLPVGSVEGLNDWEETVYGGPCPPIGKHRYAHKLYALDVALKVAEGASKAQLEQAMRGHVLEHAELIGLYARKDAVTRPARERR